MFEHVEPFAGDPILSLNEDFQKDPRPHKINLSIGIYFDDAGRIPVLDSVRRAEAHGGRARRRPSPTCRSKARPTSASGAGAPVRRRPRGARRQAGGDDPVGGLERRPQGRRRLHRPLASRQRGLGQRPELGEPPLDVRRRRPRGPLLSRTTTPATGALAFDAMCDGAAPAAGEERRAAARLLPQPDRRRPDPGAVGRADPAARRGRAAALPRPRLPGLRRRHRRGRLRGARAGRGPRQGRPADVVLRRQLVLQEHEPVRRALRRAQRRLRRRGARRSTCSASSSSRCAATTRARRSTAARSSPPCSASRRCGATWEAGAGGDARAHPGDAQGAARRPRRRRCRAATSATSSASAACSATPA